MYDWESASTLLNVCVDKPSDARSHLSHRVSKPSDARSHLIHPGLRHLILRCTALCFAVASQALFRKLATALPGMESAPATSNNANLIDIKVR